MINSEKIPEDTPIEVLEETRKAYQKPELIELGDLRALTLGGSPGGGDSGAPGTQFPPG
jgi:hypothetical protein